MRERRDANFAARGQSGVRAHTHLTHTSYRTYILYRTQKSHTGGPCRGAQDRRGVPGFLLGKLSHKAAGVGVPAATHFASEDDKLAHGAAEQFWVAGPLAPSGAFEPSGAYGGLHITRIKLALIALWHSNSVAVVTTM